MKPLTQTEQQFTNSVLDWAKTYGWRRFHVRNSGHAGNSYVQGDRGFPDLVLVRAPRLIFAELKIGKSGTVKGDPTLEQRAWHNALFDARNGSANIEVHVWRPENWSEILVALSR